MSPTQLDRLRLVVGGAAAGVVVTVIVAALLWPDAASGTTAQRGAPSGRAVRTPSTAAAAPSGDATPEKDTRERDPDGFVDMTSDSDTRPADADGKPVDEVGWERTAVAGSTDLPDSRAVTCPNPTVRVDDARGFAHALAEARPGTVVRLADGVYSGRFVLKARGTASSPVFVCGARGAVLDGADVEEGYVLHLDGAQYVRVVGLTIRNGQKGVMADTLTHSVLQGLAVTSIGDEAIHLRKNSVANVVRDNAVSDTGNRKEKYGEGVYIGTAESNWCSITSWRPDRSDRNVVRDNLITGTTSESVDVKEGTTGGSLLDNTFDGRAITGVDSWVDVKGNAWLVQGNRGTASPLDGFQTHEIRDGWGTRNLFKSNVARVDGPGFGYNLTPVRDNVLACSNTASGAAQGLANVPCQR